MDTKLEKAFRVSDGLASLVHKKVTGLVRDLQGEGALTKEEGKKVIDGLGKVKKSLYDNVSAELKKALNKKKSSPKKSTKKRN
jgi:polyhydroxyalkanoate synthesis regulator phasin